MKKGIAITAGVLVLSFASVASAETMMNDTLMKDTMATGTMMNDTMHDGAALKSDSMMKTDTMMKSDAMMMSDGDLTIGARGDAVTALQTTLIEKGFLVIPAGVAKGYFGPLTKEALKKYQTSLGVKATGYYGPLTRSAMHAATMMKSDSMMKDGAMKPAN